MPKSNSGVAVTFVAALFRAKSTESPQFVAGIVKPALEAWSKPASVLVYGFGLARLSRGSKTRNEIAAKRTMDYLVETKRNSFSMCLLV